MKSKVIIREAIKTDDKFIYSLSPTLAETAQLSWHSEQTIQSMQVDYIAEMLAPTTKPSATFIAEVNNTPLGFIHVRKHKDSISQETCATIPLLAIAPESQGIGLGKCLIETAESWARKQGCRLIHLEVFANNQNAYDFYQYIGFKPETLHMIKPLSS